MGEEAGNIGSKIEDNKLYYSSKDESGNYVDKEFDMQEHFDYDKNNLPQEIKDFIKLKGYTEDNYVAQKSGKLVLEDENGKEIEFDKSEVNKSLNEYYGYD
jgi:uncharacterized protein YdgA (DUF945 family)